MTAYSELREKVEEAKGADYGVDADLTRLFGEITSKGLYRCAGYLGFPEFTSSTDAALALVKEKLPDAFIELAGPFQYLHIPTPKPNYWCAELGVHNCPRGWGATAPLAILSALLRALEAKDAGHG